MVNLYLLSNQYDAQTLSLATAVLADQSRDVFFIEEKHLEKELEPLSLLHKRLELNLINATGTEKVSQALDRAGLQCQEYSSTEPDLPEVLHKHFGKPRGYCFADPVSPADSLKAAALAVRLGFYFLPLEAAPLVAESGLPLIVVDPADGAGKHLAERRVDAKFKIISDDRDLVNLFADYKLPLDYVVLYNSADLAADSREGDCLGKLWVSGLSLLLLNLATFRNVFPFDAASSEPDPELIENELNALVHQLGLQPKYLAVLASPALVPFFYEEKKAITAWTEEMVRDIHIKLNNDLFFDLAEGRLMQHTTGGLATQLISTRRYSQIGEQTGNPTKEVLVVSTPHVKSGIIFASDDSLIEAQLLPLLEETGYRIKQLKGVDAHYSKVSRALGEADLFLFTGHGGPEGLHTYGHTLNRADLPLLPPQVVYTSACSTVAQVPHWVSNTEGLEWKGIAVDSRQVIGLSFVEKGALCYVGGATIEDLQYSTSIYAVFMEALLVKGMSVGEAVKETRHFVSLFAATLLQTNPEAYRKYRWGTANTIHQQILIGDPAFVPNPLERNDLDLPMEQEIDEANHTITLSVTIPPGRWRRASTPVTSWEASLYYYRSRNIDVITPYGADIVSWGDYYRIAPDAENICEDAVMSSFVHLKADLPAGMVPQSLELCAVEAEEPFCLLCDSKAEPISNLMEKTSCFKLPYLLQSPLEIDMREGWAFSVEQSDDRCRVHWLASLLLINEKERSAAKLQKLTFKLQYSEPQLSEGKICDASGRGGFLLVAGHPATGTKKEQGDEAALLKNPMFAITEADGSFKIKHFPGALLQVEEQFPLYGLLNNYQVFKRNAIKPQVNVPLSIELSPPALVTLNGRLLDRAEGGAISGGLIRIFRGENDPVGDPLIDAFAAEAYTDLEGRFIFKLPSGKYLLYAAAAPNGLFYKSAGWPLQLKTGEDFYRIFALDQAAVICGKVGFQGYKPPDPATVAIKRYPPVKGEGALSKMPVNRDGSYHCLVSFQDRFRIVIEEEGYIKIEDDNQGHGYKLEPQDRLERNYLLERKELIKTDD